MEAIDMKKLKWTMKKKQLKESAVRTAKRTSEWVKQNRDALIVAAPAMAATAASVTKGARIVLHRHNVRRDERTRQTNWYDPSLGHYWQLKRPLKQSEQLLVNQRRKNGETLGDIFASMKVLR